MVGRVAPFVALVLLVSSCAEVTRIGASPTPVVPTVATAAAGITPATAASAPSAAPSVPSAPTPRPATEICTVEAACGPIQSAIDRLDAARMNDHLLALTSVGSRDPRNPGHAKAVAYIKEQLAANADRGWKIESQRTVYQGIPLENIFATIDLQPEDPPVASIRVPAPAPSSSEPTGWILVSAHYDSTANRTPGWRPAVDAAPGADDNATGTAALLEFQRLLSTYRLNSRSAARVVLAFFDGEELFFKGSGAYMATLSKPYPYKAAIDLDMVGFNPIADRLDLLWYTSASAGLRDRVIKANDAYKIGVSPLTAQFAADGNTIMDAAPFGIAGIPSIALCQRYGENDATFPGNYTFHTVTDTPDKITNKRLWLKAAKLTLATALQLAEEPTR
jgi:Peptidase family M28